VAEELDEDEEVISKAIPEVTEEQRWYSCQVIVERFTDDMKDAKWSSKMFTIEKKEDEFSLPNIYADLKKEEYFKTSTDC